MIEFGIGSDPEVFALDAQGEIASSIGVINGKQKKMFPVEGGFIQEDNVAFEFNPNPAFSMEEFLMNTVLCRDSLVSFMAQKGLTTSPNDFLMFPDELLNSKAAKEVGCSPEMDAWTLRIMDPPSLGNYRCAGGHIAISWECGNDEFARTNLVKALDYYLAAALKCFEVSNQRRHYYGKMGSHRPKFKSQRNDFDGVEYRVLSNMWIWNEEYIEFIYRTVQYCLDHPEETVMTAMMNEDSLRRFLHSGRRNPYEYIPGYSTPYAGILGL